MGYPEAAISLALLYVTKLNEIYCYKTLISALFPVNNI